MQTVETTTLSPNSTNAVLPAALSPTGLGGHKKYKGLSIVVKNEIEFNTVKSFLGQYLYLDYVPQIATTKTGIIVHYDKPKIFSIGSVGSADYQEQMGCRLVEFSDFFNLQPVSTKQQVTGWGFAFVWVFKARLPTNK